MIRYVLIPCICSRFECTVFLLTLITNDDVDDDGDKLIAIVS